MLYRPIIISRLAYRVDNVVRGVWFFPVILLIPTLIFTTLGISGSSIGSYSKSFNGDASDSRLISGSPRPIRSDEWLVNSQVTIAQEQNNFDRVNKNIGLGEDVSLMVDVPYSEWTTIFRPHNLAFLVLPFDNAFAFRWWFMGYLLILSVYLFTLKLLPRKRLVASLLSTTLLFSPFIQWWYLYGTLGSIYYCLFGGLVLIKILEQKSLRKSLPWAVLLTYLATCFVLVLYPPFQIPCALAVTSIVAGYFAYTFKWKARREWLPRLGVAICALIVAVAIVFSFIASRSEVISIIRNTAYPGMRNIVSGEYGGKVDTSFGLMRVFSSPLSFGLQNDNKAANYYTNQSEAATFIFLNLIFVPFVLLGIYKKSAKERSLYDYLFISTSVVLGLFVLKSFTPFFNLPFKLLLLNNVQTERLEIGIMVLCVIQLILLGTNITQNISNKMAIAASVTGFAFFTNASIVMAKRYPIFAPKMYLVITVCLLVGAIIYFVLRKKYYTWGIGLFLVLNIFSTFKVNPLYVGAIPEPIAKADRYIDDRYTDDKSWVVVDNLLIENFPQMAGKPAFTGVNTYPQLALWNLLDPSQAEKVEYNRYAHVVFTTAPFVDGTSFSNPSPDVLLVKFDCEVAKKLPNFGHVISLSDLPESTLSCLKKDGTLEYPKQVLHFYTYQPSL